MSMFSLTCSVSDLAIEPGDPTVWIPLEDVGHSWGLKGAPVYGTYDGYGRFVPKLGPQGLPASSIAIDHFVSGLQKDLVELPVGNNIYHDVAVRRGQDFAHYAEAVYAGRLRVWAASLSRASETPFHAISAAMVRADVWSAAARFPINSQLHSVPTVKQEETNLRQVVSDVRRGKRTFLELYAPVDILNSGRVVDILNQFAVDEILMRIPAHVVGVVKNATTCLAGSDLDLESEAAATWLRSCAELM